MKLYHYWRSTSSWRVRMALHYKKIPCELVHVSLLNGESESPAHLKRHPGGYVPVLELDDGTPLIESLPIIQYLDENFGGPKLIPSNSIDKAQVLALAEIINAGTHPLQNPPVTALLTERFQASPVQQTEWAAHWIRNGLDMYEKLLTRTAHEPAFSFKNGYTLADLCVLSICYNAQRYGVDINVFPQVFTIVQNASQALWYQSSHPERYKPVE